jgi:hypothetical protein
LEIAFEVAGSVAPMAFLLKLGRSLLDDDGDLAVSISVPYVPDDAESAPNGQRRE